jgi:hypothetical protein
MSHEDQHGGASAPLRKPTHADYLAAFQTAMPKVATELDGAWFPHAENEFGGALWLNTPAGALAGLWARLERKYQLSAVPRVTISYQWNDRRVQDSRGATHSPLKWKSYDACPSITVAATRTPAQVVAEIRRRLLPEVFAMADQAAEMVKAAEAEYVAENENVRRLVELGARVRPWEPGNQHGAHGYLEGMSFQVTAQGLYIDRHVSVPVKAFPAFVAFVQACKGDDE